MGALDQLLQSRTPAATASLPSSSQKTGAAPGNGNAVDRLLSAGSTSTPKPPPSSAPAYVPPDGSAVFRGDVPTIGMPGSQPLKFNDVGKNLPNVTDVLPGPRLSTLAAIKRGETINVTPNPVQSSQATAMKRQVAAENDQVEKADASIAANRPPPRDVAAILEDAKDVARSIPRTLASLGMSASGNEGTITPSSAVGKFLLGPKPISSMGKTISTVMDTADKVAKSFETPQQQKKNDLLSNIGRLPVVLPAAVGFGGLEAINVDPMAELVKGLGEKIVTGVTDEVASTIIRNSMESILRKAGPEVIDETAFRSAVDAMADHAASQPTIAGKIETARRNTQMVLDAMDARKTVSGAELAAPRAELPEGAVHPASKIEDLTAQAEAIQKQIDPLQKKLDVSKAGWESKNPGRTDFTNNGDLGHLELPDRAAYTQLNDELARVNTQLSQERVAQKKLGAVGPMVGPPTSPPTSALALHAQAEALIHPREPSLTDMPHGSLQPPPEEQRMAARDRIKASEEQQTLRLQNKDILATKAYIEPEREAAFQKFSAAANRTPAYLEAQDMQSFMEQYAKNTRQPLADVQTQFAGSHIVGTHGDPEALTNDQLFDEFKNRFNEEQPLRASLRRAVKGPSLEDEMIAIERNHIPTEPREEGLPVKESRQASILSKPPSEKKGAVSRMFREITSWLNPAALAPANGLDVIMKHKGEMEKKIFQVERAAEAARKYWEKVPEADQLDFLKKFESGQSMDNPELDQFAKMYRERLDNVYNAITQFKDLGKIDNYFPHFWDRGEEAAQEIARVMSKRPMQGSKRFFKKRVLETIEEGIKLGFKPLSTNPEELVRLHEMDAQKFVMAQGIKKDLTKLGLWKYVPIGETAPEGFVRINDAVAKRYLPPTIEIQESYDKHVRDKLKQFMEDFKIQHDRKAKIGHGGALGYATPKDKITTKFGGSEGTIIHEIGHILDSQYGLEQTMVHNPLVSSELRALADLRHEGTEATPHFKSYVRKGAEKMANMLEAFIRTPDKMKEVAPNTYNVFRRFLETHDELRPLLDVAPTLVRDTGTTRMGVGGIVMGGEYYSHPDIGRLVNNFLSKDTIRQTVIGRSLMNIKNSMNGMQLGLSAFHITAEAINSIVSEVGIGLSKLTSPKTFTSGLLDILKSPIAPALYYKSGNALYAGSPELMAIEKDLFAGGASLKKNQYFKNSVFENFIKNVKGVGSGFTAMGRGEARAGLVEASKNFGQAALRAPLAIVEGAMRPLMSNVIPRIKVGAFRSLFEAELTRNADRLASGELTRTTLARQVWNSIENRFGQLNYDNLFWNQNFKASMMLTFRAVGWNLGTVRELGGAALGDVPKQAARLLTGKFNKMEFTPKMQYLFGLLFTTAAAGAAYQFLHTGKKPESVKDLYYPKDGGIDKNGNPTRIEFPTYMKDILAYSTHPILTVEHKTSPLLSTIIELMQNKDYFGDFIRNPNDNLPTQMKQLGAYLAGNLEPFSAQQFIKNQSSNSPIDKTVEAFFGITSAPKQQVESPGQLKVESQAFQTGPRTPEQKDLQAQKSAAKAAAQKGDYGPAQKLIDAGVITTQTGLNDLLKSAELTPYERMISNEGVKDGTRAQSIYDYLHGKSVSEQQVIINRMWNNGISPEVWDQVLKLSSSKK